ncbi:putative prolyl 4-hydroxylase 10-like protein 1 [Colletotrichum chlorophyti]|uniref:Putative prolyl 4-hydroxylase 10-like protein 1 n=1 Tax=Colletotrichum chlorophyti TaxID=708187 RepID=A0A1Q8S6W9_9PEZI|nr:putative prolyl 4-hydroxylase 10-like protein 1 [Colletotrichum chlorophyti]
MLNNIHCNRLLLFGALLPIVPTVILLWPQLFSVLLFEPSPRTYSIRIISYDPLMIYIVGFISWAERRYLLRLGQVQPTASSFVVTLTFSTGSLGLDLNEPHFQRSAVREDGKDIIHSDRTSSTAFLPHDDIVVQRIIKRASEIQGYTPVGMHEFLQLTRYREGQEFRAHLDPLEDLNMTMKHRLTTIYAILEATCENCGTQFPGMKVNWTAEDQSWCKYVDCDDHDALTVKAVPGNALFWKSYDSSGKLDSRTMHGGLPPETGIKTGVNIWTNG